MIAFKDDYSITSGDYSTHVFRKEDISRMAYNNRDNTAIIYFKKGTYFEIGYISYPTFLSILKQLEVNLSDL